MNGERVRSCWIREETKFIFQDYRFFPGELRNSKHDFVLKQIGINYEINGKHQDKTEASNMQMNHIHPYGL